MSEPTTIVYGTLSHIEPEPAPAIHPIEEKYAKLAEAAQNLIDIYRQGHTVVTYDDYKYPGLEALAKALDGVS